MSNIEYIQPIIILIILLGLYYYFTIKRTNALNNDPLQMKIADFFMDYAKGYFLISDVERSEKDIVFSDQLTNFINEGVSDRQFAHSLTMVGTMLSEDENCHIRSQVTQRLFRANDTPEPLKENQSEGVLLNEDTVYDVITNKKNCDKFCEFSLKDTVVQDYITTENIPQIILDGVEIKAPSDVFFNEYNFLLEYNIDEILEHADDEFINIYNKKIKFPHEFTTQFFDTFIVVTILPNTDKTEFIVISPSIENDFNGSLSSIYITSIMSTLSTTLMAQVELFLEIDKLLEYLRNDHKSN